MMQIPRATAHHTDKGPHRPRNEDIAYSDVENSIHIVADGLGGAAAGDRAARIATELLCAALLHQGAPVPLIDARLPAGESREMLDKMAPPEEELEEPANRLRFAFLLAHHGVLAEGRATGCVGMATAVAVAWQTCDAWWIGHVGDCRAYSHDHGRLSLLTHDHSLSAALSGRRTLPEHGERSPFLRSRLTQVVGGESVPTPDVRRWFASPRSRLLLCSDGVWGSLSDDQLCAYLEAEDDVDRACRSLVDGAIRSGSRDNATALVLAF
jgi:PPM family protein phosphatase